MTQYQYLKERNFYKNTYDWHTVQECRRYVKRIKEDKKLINKYKSSNKKGRTQLDHYMVNLPLYFIKGNRYIHRKEFLDECIESDRKKDEYIEKIPEPAVFCPRCNKKMELTVKDLESDLDDKNLRMFFLFRCDPCNEQKGLYDNGEPYVFKSDFCPKCHKEWDRKHIKSRDKVITKSSCKHCGHKEESVLDFTKEFTEDNPDADFEKDRKEFCLSEKEGEEYRKWITYDYPQIKGMVDEWEEKKKNKDVYDKVKKIRKLTISELSDLLSKELVKADYKGLVVTNTEITRDLIVTFTIQDTKVGRDEGYSKSDLKKTLKKLLDNTNWKLMSDGVSYKLGLLAGRLRGIDQEKVLVDEIKEGKGIR